MKKIYYFIVMTLVMAIGVSSCTHEEDDLFGESAAQRLNKSVEKYQNLRKLTRMRVKIKVVKVTKVTLGI